MSGLRFLLFFFLTPGIISSCSIKEKKLSSPKAFYEKALKYKKQSNFQKALETLNEMRQQFPYSSYKSKAHQLLGDIYFEQEDYSLAADIYKRFSLIYPETNKAYILNQLGLCYLHQLPSTPDRDMSKAAPALDYFQKLIDLPEDHPYKKTATKHKADLLNSKAKKEFMIATFYLKKGWDEAAFNRLNHIIRLYPESPLISEVLSSAYALAKKLKKDSKSYKNQLKKQFPRFLKHKNPKKGA